MLVQFSFSNFKCFKDENCLNLTASNTGNKSYYAHKAPFNLSLLKTLAIYGANASGKTKLFEAMKFMRNVICPPKRDGKIPMFDYWQTKYDTFKLNTQMPDTESFFETIFILDNTLYRYGFTLNKSNINSEWLYIKKQRETLVFSRDNLNIEIAGKHINEKIYNTIKEAGMLSATIPLLSILATFNDNLSKKIVDWFESIIIISANDIKTIEELTDTSKKNRIVSFLKAFDINIEDVALHEVPYDKVPDKIKAIIGAEANQGKFYDGIRTTHKVYNDLYERVGSTQFSLEIDESFGTNRLFHLSWPIIKSLKEGTLLFIDEFDSGIHTNIIKTIIRLFYLCESKAQLIINTQNTTLLSAKDDANTRLFRKDQIYMVNKNRYGESSLLPVTDFNADLRSNMEKYYLNGEITGVPYVNIYDLLNAIK